MDAKQIAERHVIERYLAGQLTEPEAEAFEAYIEAHPEVIQDIDLVSRMKCGLAALHERRELAAVVQARRRAWMPALIAASVAALALALFLWVVPHGGGTRAMLASAAGDLTDNRRVALPVLAHLDVVRTRGESDNVLVVPSLDPNVDSSIELGIDMRAEKPGSRYTVELLRIDGGALDSRGKLSDVPAQADGSLRIYVRGSALATGNYLLRAQADGEEPVEFVVRVRAAAP
ncbi:MAG TPA: hypothetical protein VFL16_11800 [Steroidobacteraceae bacterium]|nr:hypothetical protein [Steroidobacteraceae bacterium]HEX5161888.1 hypothetical protein [Steroidobacteraceae bacterium]